MVRCLPNLVSKTFLVNLQTVESDVNTSAIQRTTSDSDLGSWLGTYIMNVTIRYACSVPQLLSTILPRTACTTT